MIVDFRRPSKSPPPILIKNVEVERVSTYKYLGSVLDEKLAWTAHVDNIIKRLNSRMFCSRKLGRFCVRTYILNFFYQSTIMGVWRYCLICLILIFYDNFYMNTYPYTVILLIICYLYFLLLYFLSQVWMLNINNVKYVRKF